jgi:Uma2 family endonuclease
MNEMPWTLRRRPTTKEAEGWPRLKWSFEEFEHMSELGFFGGQNCEPEHIEFIGGELVPMHEKTPLHENVRCEIDHFILRRLPRDVRGSPCLGWRIDKETYLEPDLPIFVRSASIPHLSPKDILLLMEVADTSLSYDLGFKAKLYAALGVREYWVVNAKTLETIVHLEPGSEGYGKISTHAPSETIAPLALPTLAVSLGALKIG